jgi:acetyl esterase/lipase
MSPQLAAIALFLRLVNKPMLAGARDLGALRASFERRAATLFRAPRSARFAEEAGPPPLLWADGGPVAPGVALMHLHGGGFVMGSPRTHRHLGAALSAACGARCALPAYRLAPEHPHPAALEDALAAYAALTRRGLRVALSGDSAGGGLGFALTPAARAAGLPDPACVVAFSPWCDMTVDSPTIEANARADAMLPASRIREVAAMRMGALDRRDPAASPIFATYDRPPPPALILASRREILAGDAAAMAATLRRAGGVVRLDWSPDAPHAWPIFCGLAPEADAAVTAAGRFIAEHLTPKDRP